jgi:alkanesulfonate monooxygenase SsuD/methylene tetrahydromethanopterin reductase-like flavin-dependent oxidoreductase (luciferase family)
MRFAVDVPNFGPFGDPRVLADLAQTAEQAGWDGFFIWDHLYWGPRPHADPWVALAAIALRTERVRIGPMITPLPRRRPHKLARETVSVDQLSNGRLILGVGLGGGGEEYGGLGEADEARVRGAQLDEGLDLLTAFWSGNWVQHQGTHYTATDHRFLPEPVQQPRIPIWVAGFWPNKKPMRRAARFDGVFPLTDAAALHHMVPVDELQAAYDYVAAERGNTDFDRVHVGRTTGDPAQDAGIVGPYAAIGVTWWLEDVNPWLFGGDGDRWPEAAMRQRIAQGPPRL